jgi:LysR family transcriptional regulator, nitrogen assimilation regulatory protein
MELRQLRYFVRIVDMGSLSRAAGVLHIAQSALSQHVASLEAEFKSVLLTRTTRGVTPTEAGTQLYRHAQAILRQADDARFAVASRSSEPTGQVAIGIPLSLVAPLAFHVFEAVRSRYPGIKLRIHEGLSGTILEWVKNGRLTLGLAFDDGNLEGLESRRIIAERLFLVVNPDSRLARRKLVSLRETQGLDLLLPTPDHGVRALVEGAMAKEGLDPPHIVAEINSLTMMKHAVEANLGVSILSWASVAAEVAQGKLVAVEIARPALTRIAALCFASSAPRSHAMQCVASTTCDAIRDVLRLSPWRGVRCLFPE